MRGQCDSCGYTRVLYEYEDIMVCKRCGTGMLELDTELNNIIGESEDE